MSAHVQIADKLGSSMPPQNGADFMKAIASILSPQQLELVQYLMMHPDQYSQVRQQFFASAQGTAGMAAAAGGSTAPAQPVAPSADLADPTAGGQAAPAGSPQEPTAPVNVHVHTASAKRA